MLKNMENKLESEIKKYTEKLYHETFGNGQGTLDEFDWEDISTVIQETARHFAKWPSWKPSEEQMEALQRASTNEYLSAKQFDILVSLYKQLKKLL